MCVCTRVRVLQFSLYPLSLSLSLPPRFFFFLLSGEGNSIYFLPICMWSALCGSGKHLVGAWWFSCCVPPHLPLDSCVASSYISESSKLELFAGRVSPFPLPCSWFSFIKKGGSEIYCSSESVELLKSGYLHCTWHWILSVTGWVEDGREGFPHHPGEVRAKCLQ